ncbi:hypothetical protein HYH08_21155 [Bradyrhizobium sp. BR 10289]|nr:hypothetical protein [Bradyrhizobium sp. BR 10289]
MAAVGLDRGRIHASRKKTLKVGIHGLVLPGEEGVLLVVRGADGGLSTNCSNRNLPKY